MGGVRPVSSLISNPEISGITGETWIMARCKHGYFGGYPAGSLERMRQILVAGNPEASIWHIPGGKADKYNGAGGMPLRGYGPNDVRIDLDPDVNPDICMDVRDLHRSILPVPGNERYVCAQEKTHKRVFHRPAAIIIDRPYSKNMAESYLIGPKALPNLINLLRSCLQLVQRHGLVGVLDWTWPRIPKTRNLFGKLVPMACCIAAYPVTTGEGSQWRGFHVIQRVEV